MNKISKIDGLTDVGNRLYYMEVTKELFKDGVKKLTYSIIDLFRLKYINDTLGHIYGDKYIKLVANLLKEELDKDDYLFRIGGDEFVVLSPAFKKEQMIGKFERVNKKLSEESFDVSLPFPLMINYGVVDDKMDLDSFNSTADKFMSEHKSNTYKTLQIDRRR